MIRPTQGKVTDLQRCTHKKYEYLWKMKQFYPSIGKSGRPRLGEWVKSTKLMIKAKINFAIPFPSFYYTTFHTKAKP